MSAKPSETLRRQRQVTNMLKAQIAHLEDEHASDLLALNIVNQNNDLLHEDLAERDDTIGRLEAIIKELRGNQPVQAARRQNAPVDMVAAQYGSDGLLHVGDRVFAVRAASEITGGKMLQVGERVSIQVKTVEGSDELTAKIPAALLARMEPA